MPEYTIWKFCEFRFFFAKWSQKNGANLPNSHWIQGYSSWPFMNFDILWKVALLAGPVPRRIYTVLPQQKQRHIAHYMYIVCNSLYIEATIGGGLFRTLPRQCHNAIHHVLESLLVLVCRSLRTLDFFTIVPSAYFGVSVSLSSRKCEIRHVWGAKEKHNARETCPKTANASQHGQTLTEPRKSRE